MALRHKADRLAGVAEGLRGLQNSPNRSFVRVAQVKRLS